MGPLRLMACYEAAIRRAVRDMFPVNNCMGYISTPRTSVGQAWRATLQAHGKVWWAHPSSLMASLSKAHMVSPCACYKSKVHAMQAASASITPVMQAPSASIMEFEQVIYASLMATEYKALASQIEAMQQAFTSLTASEALASFWQRTVSVSDMSLH